MLGARLFFFYSASARPSPSGALGLRAFPLEAVLLFFLFHKEGFLSDMYKEGLIFFSCIFFLSILVKFFSSLFGVGLRSFLRFGGFPSL